MNISCFCSMLGVPDFCIAPPKESLCFPLSVEVASPACPSPFFTSLSQVCTLFLFHDHIAPLLFPPISS